MTLVAEAIRAEEVREIRGDVLSEMIMSNFSYKRVSSLLHVRIAYRLLTTFLAALLLTAAFAQKPVPELWGSRVHDDAHVLQQETIDRLEQQLKQYEDSTSNQIAILTITSLEGEVVEEYALRVAETWKLGSASNDNGVLLLVAVDDHKMRIEVGQGLEGVLTDAQSSRIIRNELAPAFRRGDYDGGIQAGINAMVQAIGGEYSADDNSSNDFEGLTLKERILTGLFLFGILGIFTLIGLFSKGAMGWVLYFFLMVFYYAFFMVVGGSHAVFYSYIVGYPLLKFYLNRHPKWKNKMMKWSGGRGTWGGGSGGWSSGGGGFSGGGGSFGGGGSSGSW